ncbi:integral membrane protein [Stagonosporopsis vannaccii]|nr:integral membrane protein [Stagonosporopsis vannaccii]
MAHTPFGTVAFAVEIPLIVLALAAVLLRLWSRWATKGIFAPDDALIALGTGCAIARTVVSCISADDLLGYDRKGVPSPDQPHEVLYYQHIFERRIFYLFSVTLIRLSILASYLRVFPPVLLPLRRSCYLLFLLTICLFVAVLSVLIASCSDIYKLWTPHWRSFTGSTCFSSPAYSYTAAVGDCVLDLCIFTLPVPFVLSLSQVGMRQRFTLVVVFALGVVVCGVALVQVPFIMRREKQGTYFGPAINMLVAIQIAIAIVAASLPDLRALVRRVKEGRKGSGGEDDAGMEAVGEGRKSAAEACR